MSTDIEIIPPEPDAPQSAYEQLRPVERLFVDGYITSGNPRGAALRAYKIGDHNRHVTVPDVRAKELMARPLVKAAIAERQREITALSTITAVEVVSELAKIAKANMADYVRISEQGEPYVDLTDVTRDQMAAVKSVKVEDFTEGRGEDAREIRKVSFELHDKLNALGQLTKIMGMNAPEKLDVRTNGKTATDIRQLTANLTPDQMAEYYAASLRDDEDDE